MRDYNYLIAILVIVFNIHTISNGFSSNNIKDNWWVEICSNHNIDTNSNFEVFVDFAIKYESKKTEDETLSYNNCIVLLKRALEENYFIYKSQYAVYNITNKLLTLEQCDYFKYSSKNTTSPIDSFENVRVSFDFIKNCTNLLKLKPVSDNNNWWSELCRKHNIDTSKNFKILYDYAIKYDSTNIDANGINYYKCTIITRDTLKPEREYLLLKTPSANYNKNNELFTIYRCDSYRYKFELEEPIRSSKNLIIKSDFKTNITTMQTIKE